MAAMKTSELVVPVQPKDITECWLCNETYKDPRILPCIHTLCLKCLEEVGGKTSKGPGDRMPCPLCRKDFMIPEEGYTALQKHFFMEKIIEMAKVASPSGGPDLCEACMDKESESMSISEVPLADMYCTDCQQKMCQEYSLHHRKHKLTRNHQILLAVDFPNNVQIPRLSNCEKHEREHKLYCSECKELLCISCFGESHQNHRLQDVRSTVEGFKNEIRNRISCFEICESQVLGKKEFLNCDVQQYCENAESLKLEVLVQRDATIKLVNDHADLILQGIDQSKVQKRSQVEAEIEDTGRFLVWLESLKVYCADVMTKGSASDICCAVNRLKAAEEIQEQIESEIKTNYLHKISFQISDLEEFVKTENYNIIGTIQECQTGIRSEGETETATDITSHQGGLKLEDGCRMPISGNNGILKKICDLKEGLENEQRRMCELEMEKKALEERLNKLKLEHGIKRLRKSTSEFSIARTALCKQVPPPRTSIDYKRSPNLVKTIQSFDGSFNTAGNIFGLTILDDELFLGCCMVDIDHSVVEVYDIKTFSFIRQWPVKRLSLSNTGVARIRCIASCARHKCLYACVSTVRGFEGHRYPVIQRTDVNGSTGEGNVIIITGSNLLFEYSRDGVLVHEMKLSSSLGIEYPWHALKLANDNLVVSHGLGRNHLHRVLILSESGQITKSFGEMRATSVYFPDMEHVPQVCEQKQLNEPVHLTVDGFGNLLVADRGNNRIVVLNSKLEFVSFINTTEPLQRPRYMCVDADRKRLFVCEGPRKISVFDFSF